MTAFINYMNTRNVLDWLDETAGCIPEAPAFRSQDQEVNYRQLLKRSKEIGSFLAERVPSQQGVLIFMEKGPQCLCAMMGIVRAGCFYTPIDPVMPKERMKLILSVLQPACIVSSTRYADKARELVSEGSSGSEAQGMQIPVFAAEEIPEVICEDALAAVRKKHLDNDLLYVLFTSGSTGLPKGVASTHCSVIDFIDWTTSALPVDEDCIFGNQAPLYFDNSVLDI